MSELVIYPNFLTGNIPLEYIEKSSHFDGKKYILHGQEAGDSGVAFTVNDKLLFILHFLIHKDYYNSNSTDSVLEFTFLRRMDCLNDEQFKNMFVSLGASSVLFQPEMVATQISSIQKLFKDHTGYELVIPLEILDQIIASSYLYTTDARTLMCQIWSYISSGYRSFSEGIEDFLFDPRIAIARIDSSADTKYNNSYYNQITDEYVSNKSIETYLDNLEYEDIYPLSYKKIFKATSKSDFNIEFIRTMEKFQERKIPISQIHHTFYIWDVFKKQKGRYKNAN